MSQTTPPTGPAPQSAPPAAPRRSILSRLPDGAWKLFAVAALIIAVGIGLQLLWPADYGLDGESAAGISEIHSSGPIRINELMSKNGSSLVDENGLTADWIEVANIGGSPVNLYGYALAHDAKSANIFYFPDLTLNPGECTLVFADSAAGESATHAPFSLSSQGGTLMLFNRKGTVIDSLNFPAMSSDISYACLDAGVWAMSGQPTPGRLNTEADYQALHTADSSAGVEISEILASNTQYAPDENGAYHDWFELHNRSGAALDLSGWFVSDDPSRPVKWQLPEGFVLQPDEYRVVYASKLDRPNPEYPHASFGLSSGGEAVVLSDARGRLIDEVEFGQSQANLSWFKKADGAWVQGTPSPAAANQ